MRPGHLQLILRARLPGKGRGWAPAMGVATVAFWVRGGCRNPLAQGDCSTVGVYGLTMEVTDATTGLAPTSAPRVTIIDGAYTEVASPVETSPQRVRLVAAVERPGRYTVDVQAAGYWRVIRSPVDVTRGVTRGGSCNNLRGVTVDVRLQRDTVALPVTMPATGPTTDGEALR